MKAKNLRPVWLKTPSRMTLIPRLCRSSSTFLNDCAPRQNKTSQDSTSPSECGHRQRGGCLQVTDTPIDLEVVDGVVAVGFGLEDRGEVDHRHAQVLQVVDPFCNLQNLRRLPIKSAHFSP